MVFSESQRRARILELEAELLDLRGEPRVARALIGPVSARRLFEASPIGLALCRRDGQLIDVNPAFAAILGRTVEETLGLSYWDITPQRHGDDEARQLELLERTGRYGPYTKHYIHSEGHAVAVRLSGRIVEEAGERFIWSSAEDITDMARAADALREGEERYRSIVETTGEWIWELNLAFKHTYSNRGVERILDYTPEEFLSIDTLALMHPEDAEDVGKKLPALMANKEGWRGWHGGQLGYGPLVSTLHEPPDEDLEVGGKVLDLALGVDHTCALLDSGRVRCWGLNHLGQLGLGDPTLERTVSIPAEIDPLPECD